MQTKNRKGVYRYVRYVLLSYALSPGMVCGVYQNPPCVEPDLCPGTFAEKARIFLYLNLFMTR